ncbi:hypothetical protein C8035_v010876 [Colletotrichum spinosum]|uniref:Transmembrane protein n=1 Tax=Colletotrichum spinosum TaxID=1347390 RepID=A0A4R8QHA6_9PEZI|nr:hypothetical protein C8035_v010876 [Colletotrichum spinosum]
MNTKALLALLFASMVAAVPAVSENEGALLNTRQRGPVPPSGPSCCSNIPGTCNCGCVSFFAFFPALVTLLCVNRY